MKGFAPKAILFFLLVFMSIGCDRVTKQLAREHLSGMEPKSYMNDTFRLDYVENTGAAMSLGADWPAPAKFWVLTVLPVVFLLGMAAFVLKTAGKLNPWQVAAASLLFAGGTGNLLDRIFNLSRVPDFMNMGIGTVRTGIFNVADVCVMIGVAILIGYELLKKRETGDAEIGN